MNGPTQEASGARIGCLVAVVLLLAPGLLASILVGMPGGEWPVALFWGLLLAAPFGYLGLDGTKDWLPWTVTVGLTALFWGAFIASLILSGPGVNLGSALAMLAAPIFITAAAWMSNSEAE